MRERKQTVWDEDHELVSLCKKGEVDAFEILVKKHQKRMLNIAYRMVGNYEEACEIVQEAFISAYRSMKNFKGKAKFSTWLSAIVMNLSKNRLKQLKAQLHREEYSIDNPVLTKGDPASSEPSALEKLEKRDIQQKVQRCIDSLDDEFREVVVLRDIQGFSYDEIGHLLKVPEGTVKSRLFRAREVLKDCLKQVIGDL